MNMERSFGKRTWGQGWFLEYGSVLFLLLTWTKMGRMKYGSSITRILITRLIIEGTFSPSWIHVPAKQKANGLGQHPQARKACPIPTGILLWVVMCMGNRYSLRPREPMVPWPSRDGTRT